MDRDKQRAIAAKGGRAAHASGMHMSSARPRHAWQAARAAAISRNRQHMAAIGREGGHARHATGNRQHAAEPRRRRKGRNASRADRSVLRRACTGGTGRAPQHTRDSHRPAETAGHRVAVPGQYLRPRQQ